MSLGICYDKNVFCPDAERVSYILVQTTVYVLPCQKVVFQCGHVWIHNAAWTQASQTTSENSPVAIHWQLDHTC